MNAKSVLGLALLVLFLTSLRSDLVGDTDLGTDSAYVKTTNDHRIRITLLYVGPVYDKTASGQFVVVYLREDLRSKDELDRHHVAVSPQGYITGPFEAEIQSLRPDVKDGTRRLLTDGKEERASGVTGSGTTGLYLVYPNIKIPVAENPERADIFEYFFQDVAKGPFDVTVHDHLAADENNVHFSNVDFPPTPVPPATQ